MARQEERRFQLRDFLGVDRTAAARINSPGSWFELRNLWMPQPGLLQQRPGSAEFAHKVVVGDAANKIGTPIGPGTWSNPPDNFGWPRKSSHMAPEALPGQTKFDVNNTRIALTAVVASMPGAGQFADVSTVLGNVIFDAEFIP